MPFGALNNRLKIQAAISGGVRAEDGLESDQKLGGFAGGIGVGRKRIQISRGRGHAVFYGDFMLESIPDKMNESSRIGEAAVCQQRLSFLCL